ncbi:hypothetical protein B0H13DRAFT_2295736 [Mycena leptocephala]|nr:hypothetical protein B0H13DRAFT_2295736 [Mycena leptocephala]
MSASGTNAKASIPNKKKGGTTLQPLKSSSSRSDWLSHCIHIAKILKEAADLVPEQLSSCWRQLRSAKKLPLNTLLCAAKESQTNEKICRSYVKYYENCSYLGEQLASHQNTTADSGGLGGQVKEFFRHAVSQIKSWISEEHSSQCETLKIFLLSSKSKYNNCPPPSRKFLGRQIILDKMHQYFSQDLGQQRIYVLYGLGGAGKTQISLKFITESSQKIGESSQDTLKWLVAKTEPWLLFFDNADDPKIDLNKFLPKCNHGNIIITSRNPGLRGYGQYSQVSDMNEREATELLLKSTSQDTSLANEQIAAEVVKAGAFILESGALDTYLELFMKNRARLLRISEDIFSRAVTYRFPSWGPSKEELEKPLEFLSHLLTPTGDWDTLCFLTLTNEIKAYSLIAFDPGRKLFSIHPLVHAWGRTIMTDPESYQSIMGAILGMAISEIPELDIQLASLRLLPHVESVLHESVLQANREFSPDFRSEYGLVCDEAGRYKEAENLRMTVLTKRQQLLGDNHLDTLNAMASLAFTYQNLREFKKAEQLQLVVLEKRKQLLGDDHPDTLRAMNNLAATYWELNEFKKAEELQVIVLEKGKQLLGDDHLDTLLAMANLAVTYGQLKEFTKARLLCWRNANSFWAMIIQTPCLPWVIWQIPTGSSKSSQRQKNLRQLQEFKKAEELEVIVLEKRKQLLGDDHPDTLHAMANLASTYHKLKQFTRAAELEVVVLEKQKQLLGDDHPDTLLAMANLAATYRLLEDFTKAEELGVAVLEKQKQLLGDDHPDALHAMDNLAATYHKLKEFTKAEGLDVVVLDKRKQLLGDHHPDTLRAMGNLATTYRSLNKKKKAKELEKLVKIKQ